MGKSGRSCGLGRDNSAPRSVKIDDFTFFTTIAPGGARLRKSAVRHGVGHHFPKILSGFTGACLPGASCTCTRPPGISAVYRRLRCDDDCTRDVCVRVPPGACLRVLSTGSVAFLVPRPRCCGRGGGERAGGGGREREEGGLSDQKRADALADAHACTHTLSRTHAHARTHTHAHTRTGLGVGIASSGAPEKIKHNLCSSGGSPSRLEGEAAILHNSRMRAVLLHQL
jgi:hypothetical protein